METRSPEVAAGHAGGPGCPGADVLLAAVCSAYACGEFHERFLRDKALAIAKAAAERAERRVPVKAIVLSVEGEVLAEEWV